MLKKITASYTLALLGLIVVLGSCKKDYESIESTDEAVIQQYINANNITATKDTSGFYYQVVSQGDSGVVYKNTDTVLYNISMKSLNTGTVYYANPAMGNLNTFVGYANNLSFYDASRNIMLDANGRTIVINIQALRTAILALKPGGVARIFLPSYQAFGRNGFSAINVPSNEVLDVTITTLAGNQAAVDDRIIRNFIAAKGLTGMTRNASGVYYAIAAPGSGAGVINAGSTITANYTGKFLDDTTFDSSTDSTYRAPLNQLVEGWKQVLPMLKKGGKVRMLIPSGFGYGTAGYTGTPGNAVLDFDVEVVEIN
jgi:FKBP-type peptidyl-prolyl cis-trans isomerase FkpA